MSFKYNHLEAQKKWRRKWQESGIYNWDEKNKKRGENFVIDTPPPTVSGLLHMGHVFSYTQTDFVARYKRMRGFNVFYPIGFDDNGLATERLVEKIRDIKAGQMHREEFRKVCQEVVVEAEEQFRELFSTIALSVDWRQEYQTVSGDVIKISQMSFLDLIKRGFCTRKLGPSFWDVVDKTAVAQAEIEDKEKQGIMYDIAFGMQGGKELVIATTRPEMIAACVAIFYHPEDERYASLQGQNAISPVFGAQVPILPDIEVEMEKGTGLVMCCTFGDVKDVQWWKTYELPTKQVIDLNGRMFNTNALLDGMTVKEARSKMLEMLEASGVLRGQKPVVQFVKCAERSGAALEIIPTAQWYVRLLDQKANLIAKGRQCQWNPEYMRVRYENWVEGLNQDWCISRQRYFGVPFPVWYSKRPGEEGKILLADVSQLPCDPTLTAPLGYTIDEVVPETDVMDTWATSALTPQINAHGINTEFMVDAERFAQLYPADLRPQAHEIIRTWSFYTIAKSMLHADTIPWHQLMISGWCLAADKTKMSKSKGNVVTPQALLEDKSVDVVRYWASNSKLGVDIIYSEEVFKTGARLVNKLCNAFNFGSLHLSKLVGTPTTAKLDIAHGVIYEDMDLWIIGRLGQVISKMEEEFEQFDYAEARQVLEAFFWNDLCDNYLEIAKVRFYNELQPNAKAQQSALYALYHTLKTVLRLFAPFMPYVCDELNEEFFASTSVHTRGSWPNAADLRAPDAALQQGNAVVAILELVRKYKSIHSLSLRTTLSKVIYSGFNLSKSATADLANAANATSVLVGEASMLISEDTLYHVDCVL